MSNVDNEGLRTLDEVRARRYQAPARFRTTRRLHPGELEEIEAAAGAGKITCADDVLALVNTVYALSRRVAARFNETAQARRDAVAARGRAERAERALEARGPMADLGELADAVAGRERAERRVTELEQSVVARDRLLAQATREREEARRELEQARTSLKDARAQIADLRGERAGLYTGEQVGQLQTSEAELVSAPLKRRVGELERELGSARGRADLLQVAVDDWQRAGRAIREAVLSDRTVQALEYESYPPDLERAWAALAEAVRGVRAALSIQGERTGA